MRILVCAGRHPTPTQAPLPRLSKQLVLLISTQVGGRRTKKELQRHLQLQISFSTSVLLLCLKKGRALIDPSPHMVVMNFLEPGSQGEVLTL